MMRDRFIGVWHLVGVESKEQSGAVTKPYGDHPAGCITYDEQGRMSVLIMRAGRTTYADFLAYCGTFSVDEAAQEVIHHVEISLRPDWVGVDLRRPYEFEGQRLTLTAATEESVTRIVWERDDRR